MFPGDEHRDGVKAAALRRLSPLLLNASDDQMSTAKEAIAKAEASAQKALDAANFAMTSTSEAYQTALLAVDQCRLARHCLEQFHFFQTAESMCKELTETPDKSKDKDSDKKTGQKRKRS